MIQMGDPLRKCVKAKRKGKVGGGRESGPYLKRLRRSHSGEMTRGYRKKSTKKKLI